MVVKQNFRILALFYEFFLRPLSPSVERPPPSYNGIMEFQLIVTHSQCFNPVHTVLVSKVNRA